MRVIAAAPSQPGKAWQGGPCKHKSGSSHHTGYFQLVTEIAGTEIRSPTNPTLGSDRLGLVASLCWSIVPHTKKG